MISRSEGRRSPDCYRSILMPLHLPLDHLFFPLSAAISPRASEQVVYGSLLLKLLSTTRQRQGMSKKGQETKL